MTPRIDSIDRKGRARRPRRVLGGFTLLEVMLALAILSITLVGLLGRATGNVRLTQEVAMRGTVAALARGQMYEIEDQLLREGFQETEQTLEDDFGDQGWPDIRWQAVIEKVELPGLGSLQALQEGGGEGTGEEGAASGEQAGGGVIGQFLSMGGGGTGTGEDTSVDASFISSQFEILRQVLEASIRKVTLTVTWEVGKEEQTMVVACYFTDPAAMQKVLPGVGALAGGGGEGEESPGGGTGGGGTGGGRRGGTSSEAIPPRNPRVGVPTR
jgi:prepilin-type N-terminal cleavage/methylation domain-containing protein